jgi:hypothetical protein
MMKTSDKFLVGMVIGIVLLVIVALVVTLTRQETTYQSDETPEGVVQNYILALQKRDDEKAYGYISPKLKGYPPTLDHFIEDIDNRCWDCDNITGSTFSVEPARIHVNQARVTVEESWLGNDLLGGQNYDTYDVTLIKIKGEWKIADFPNYFPYCWGWDQGCD